MDHTVRRVNGIDHHLVMLQIGEYNTIVRTSRNRLKAKKLKTKENNLLKKHLAQIKKKNIALKSKEKYYRRRLEGKIKQVDRMIEKITNQLENEVIQ